MNTLDAIAARRSIRKFRDTPIPEQALQAILMAGIQAPSGKNKQPWRFIVVAGDKRQEMVRAMRQGIAKTQARGEGAGSAEWTVKVMDAAPVTVFIFDPDGLRPWLPHPIDQLFTELVDIQSIGAAIQNMLLAAQDQGLGSLWIGDVFYAYEELCAWLGTEGEKGEMVAAVSFGYPDESPAARPRKPIGDVVKVL